MIYKAYVNVSRDSVETNDYITLRNCGWSDNLSLTAKTIRPEGKNDYHILYLSKGAYQVNGQNIYPGNICIFKPYQPQEYYCLEEGSCYYWLHFYGKAADILFGNTDKLIYNIGEFKNLKNFCTTTVKYVNSSKNINLVKIHTELLSVLLETEELINRKIISNTEQNLIAVAEHMASNFSQRLSNEEYAKMCNMSKFHFIRKFTEYYKTTPKNYLNQIIMNQASLMLISTDMRVSQIADELGFASDMYFSTVFKKAYGMSPLEYRKHNTSS